MRLLFLVLLALVCLIQYPLWLGKGGWFKVWDLQKQVAAQRAVNEGMRARNAALDAEVHDLQSGTGAIEERARSELGMMKDGEVFVQIVPAGSAPATSASAQAPQSADASNRPGAAPATPAANRATGASPASRAGAGTNANAAQGTRR
ncbi:cell division protein FtsB [Bordetella genomosp. 9]|uniref:Cell division protein FtsB n=1 Tax=Bordetella genomosp. 9 TaxID=1416803 RepID=A0A261RFL8_9BORD|nr:cell division protein FtsB [Bordetella genomosp. 9]OZI23420.1 cell division protein FtsB [Bordetella genomosp. 9]